MVTQKALYLNGQRVILVRTFAKDGKGFAVVTIAATGEQKTVPSDSLEVRDA